MRIFMLFVGTTSSLLIFLKNKRPKLKIPISFDLVTQSGTMPPMSLLGYVPGYLH